MPSHSPAVSASVCDGGGVDVDPELASGSISPTRPERRFSSTVVGSTLLNDARSDASCDEALGHLRRRRLTDVHRVEQVAERAGRFQGGCWRMPIASAEVSDHLDDRVGASPKTTSTLFIDSDRADAERIASTAKAPIADGSHARTGDPGAGELATLRQSLRRTSRSRSPSSSLRRLELGLVLRGVELERDDRLADRTADAGGTEDRTQVSHYVSQVVPGPCRGRPGPRPVVVRGRGRMEPRPPTDGSPSHGASRGRRNATNLTNPPRRRGPATLLRGGGRDGDPPGGPRSGSNPPGS